MTSSRRGSVETELRDGAPWVIGHGEIDEAVVTAISEQTLGDLRTDGEVVVDYRDVTFIDSTALGLLVRLRQHAGSLRIIGANSSLRRQLDITGLRGAFVVE